MVDEVKQFLAENPHVVVKFYRPGCPYCQYVKPLYEAAREHYSDKVAFLSVDISHDAKNLKKEFGFSTVPEFQYYKNGEKIRSHGSQNRQIQQENINQIIEELYL